VRRGWGDVLRQLGGDTYTELLEVWKERCRLVALATRIQADLRDYPVEWERYRAGWLEADMRMRESREIWSAALARLCPTAQVKWTKYPNAGKCIVAGVMLFEEVV
jgi:hypothetical protein